jgi:hypothetical protein
VPLPPLPDFFFPLDEALHLSQEGYSPKLLRLIVRQGSKTSFGEASDDLDALVGITISPSHVQRLCERIGHEWEIARDADVAAFREDRLQPEVATAPPVAAVFLDGGRLRTRAAAQGRGVYDPHWNETKVATLQSLTSAERAVDPQPEPPPALLDPPRVARLALEMKAARSGGAERSRRRTPRDPEQQPTPRRRRRRARRKKRAARKRVQTVLASMADSEAFGWQVAAEVHKRRLGEAQRKACVCDGQNWNWTIFLVHLLPLGFIGILDVIHLAVHLYAAAQAACKDAGEAWTLYEQWLRWAWSGEVGRLLRGLRAQAQRLGEAPAGAKEDDPREVLRETVGYVWNNRERMNYPAYRRQGLPITSAAVESVIKRINRRVKGSEKFWLSTRAEGVLQIRAAHLSEDERTERYWKRPRPRGRAVGAGRLGRTD